MLQVAAFTDWLTGVSGALVFLATGALALLAKKQMDDSRRASASEALAIEKQINASVQQGGAIREAARAQLQPMVFAHGDATLTRPSFEDEAASGPNAATEYQLSPGQIGFGYKLANEGTGLALNIRHGVEIGSKRLEFGDGMQFRSLRPGYWYPAQDFMDQGNMIHITPLAVVCNLSELPNDWAAEPRRYWAEFENVFGERFRTRNPSDPQRPAEFERI